MGFLDLFRPKWKHSDPAIRAAAVKELGDDELPTLGKVAKEDPDSSVRRIALRRIADTELLLDLADHDPDEALRKTAAERAHELLLQRALAGDSAVALAALEQLRATKALVEVAKKANDQGVRNAALGRISEQKPLGELAKNADDPHIRLRAVERLTDAGALRDVALGDEQKDVALAAVDKVSDPAALGQIQKKAKSKAARARAEEKLAATAPAAAAPARDVPPERAVQEDLCRRAEALAKLDDLDEATLKLDEIRAEWTARVEKSEKSLAERFERARQKVQQKIDRVRGKRAPVDKVAQAARQALADEAAAPPARPAKPAPVVEAAPVETAAPRVDDLPKEPSPEELAEREANRERAKGELEKIVVQIEALSGQEKGQDKRLATLVDKWAGLARRAQLEDGSELASRFASAKADITAQIEGRVRAAAEADARAQERLKQAIGELEALAGSEDRKRSEAALKEARDAFEAVRERAPLRDRYEKARDLVASRIAELRDQEDWRRWANVPLLEALCVKMEALLNEPDLAKVAEALKPLQMEWKQVGPAPKEKSEALWKRFKETSDQVYARAKEHFAAADASRQENLKKLEALCVRVEEVSKGTDFKETAEQVKALQAEWKTVGGAPRKEQEVLWKRFRAACDTFFERRKAFFAERDASREENQKKLEALCVKAESLKDSTDMKGTAEKLKGLQAEWKEVGPAPKEVGDQLWQRFRAACDAFFARRKEVFEGQDEERQASLKKKEAIVARAEELRDEPDVEKAKDAYRALMTEWKQSGFAPKEEADKLWQKFRSVGNAIREGKIGYRPEDLVLPEEDPNVKFEHKAFAALANIGGEPAPAPKAKPEPVRKAEPAPAQKVEPAPAPVPVLAPVPAPVVEAAPVPITDRVTEPSRVDAAPVAAPPPPPAPEPTQAPPAAPPAPAADSTDDGWDA